MRNNGVTKLNYYGLNYQDYLQSAHWRQVRLEALDRAGNKCQLCSRKQTLEVHHNTYENLGCELPEDLIVLCDRCHAKHHDALPAEPLTHKDMVNRWLEFEKSNDPETRMLAGIHLKREGLLQGAKP